MIFYGKPAKIMTGYFYDLLRESKESIALFPRYNNIEIKPTDYQNKYEVRISNDGALGIRYDLFDYGAQIDLVPRVNPLFAIVKVVVFLAFLLLGILYTTEYETFWNEGLYMLIGFTAAFLLMMYWYIRRRAYLQAVASYVMPGATRKKLDSFDSWNSELMSPEESFDLDVWDKLNEDILPLDRSADCLGFFRNGQRMDEALRDALVKEYAEYDNSGVDNFEERKNKILFDVKEVGNDLYTYFTSVYDYSDEEEKLSSLRDKISEVLLAHEEITGAFKGIYEPEPGYSSGIFELLPEFMEVEGEARLYFLEYEKYTLAILSSTVEQL